MCGKGFPRLVFACLLLGFCLLGCDAGQVLQDLADSATEQTARTDNSVQPAPVRDGDTVTIASFNIEVFGVSKLKKPEAMDVLAKVVRRFDVVAIQEVRSVDPTVLPRFVDLINASGAQYDYVIGPRLGRTSSKEQYAFVFDTARIEYDPHTIRTAEDPQDLLHREPLITTFRVRHTSTSRPFTFTLVNIHTDPDETDIELDALDDVFLAVQRAGAGEDDVILLGDLNVDQYHLGQLGEVRNIGWIITDQKTNTRLTESYDNILFDRQATAEYTGRSGVLNLMAEFGLTTDEALKVSDHLPVWAEFSVHESAGAGPLATRPTPTPR